MNNIQRPPGVNVGVNNPDKTVYLGNINAGQPANATTDGTIRLIFTVGDSFAHIELRANGVFNDTGFRYAASSVSIGRDTILSGSAGFIETNNPSGIVGHTRSIIPHIQFDDAGTSQPQTPILDAEEIFDVFTGATISNITQAAEAVVTTTAAHGFITNDSVIISGVVGMIEVNDLAFTITFLTSTTFKLNGINSTGFTAYVSDGLAALQTTSTTIGIDLGVSPGRFLEESIHEVGTTGSTVPVTVTIYSGTDNTGFIKDRRRLAADGMLANTTLEIDYDNDLGFRVGEVNFMEFVSTANISLKTDSGGNPLTKHEAHALDTVTIIAENLMLDEDLNFMFDLSLNPVYAIQFP